MKTYKQFIAEINCHHVGNMVRRFAARGGKFGKAAAVGLTAATMATGCASTDAIKAGERTIGGYHWTKDSTVKVPYNGKYVWKQVNSERLKGLCSGGGGEMAGAHVGGCAFPSSDKNHPGLVISKYSEKDAHNVRLHGSSSFDDPDDDLYHHEIRHLKGYKHQEK